MASDLAGLGTPRYPWTRYWVRRSGDLRLHPDGFLPDPEEPFGGLHNPGLLRSPNDLNRWACLAMLGEPDPARATRSRSSRADRLLTNGPLIALDLRSYSDEGRLVRDLFESQGVQEWRRGDGVLTLLLDSLDECLIHIRTVAALLIDNLRPLPVGRLRLRLACRTAHWPLLLHQELPRLWGHDQYEELEIAPLTRADVEAAARVERVSATEFLAALQHARRSPGRRHPLCSASCSTPLEARAASRGHERDSLSRPAWKPAPRGIRAASRQRYRNKCGLENNLRSRPIAAVTILAKRPNICLDAPGAPTTEDATLDALAFGALGDGSRARPVTSDDVREVVKQLSSSAAVRTSASVGVSGSTPSISQLGTSPAGWLHQAESLVFHVESRGRRRIVPQLRELAAWLVGIEPAFAASIADQDPEVLLSAAVVLEDPEVQRADVASLLALIEAGQVSEWESGIRRYYERLRYPGLASQLMPLIGDADRDPMARRAAIHIGAACDCTDLLGLLMGIVSIPASPVTRGSSRATRFCGSVTTTSRPACVLSST